MAEGRRAAQQEFQSPQALGGVSERQGELSSSLSPGRGGRLRGRGTPSLSHSPASLLCPGSRQEAGWGWGVCCEWEAVDGAPG